MKTNNNLQRKNSQNLDSTWLPRALIIVNIAHGLCGLYLEDINRSSEYIFLLKDSMS